MAIFQTNVNNLYLIVDYYHTSQNINDNTSEVTYKIDLRGNGFRYWNLYDNSNLTVSIDGHVVHNANHSYDTNVSNPFNLKTGTYRVSHNHDGSKSSQINVRFDTQTRGVMTVSGTIHLPTIPRSAKIVGLQSANSYVDSIKTISYTVQSSSFYNRLRLLTESGAIIKTLNIGQKPLGNHGESVTLSTTELSDIYTRYTYSDRATLRASIESYSDSRYSNKIGASSELSATYLFPASLRPSIDSIDIRELNTDVATILSSGTYLNLLSLIRIQMVNTQGSHGSTVRQSYIEFGSIRRDGISTDISGDLPIGSVTVTATVIDTRGRSVNKSTTIQVLPYYRPRITTFLPARTGNGTNKAVLANVIASVKPVYVGNTNKNSYKVIVESSERNRNDWKKTYEAVGTNETITDTVSVGNEYDVAKAYDIRLTVIDAFKQRQQAVATISTISVVMAWGRDNVGVGKIPTDGRTLDVAGNVYVSGEYYSADKPIQHYQLTYNDGGSIYRYGSDLNDDKQTGMFWHRPTDRNVPMYEYGWLEVSRASDNVYQKYYTVIGRVFVRCYLSKIWREWFEVSTTRKTPWINTGVDGVYYKLDGNTLHVRGDVSPASNGNFSIGNVPASYVPQEMMFIIPEWSVNSDRNVHLQVGTKGMSILQAKSNTRISFAVSWGI